MSIARHFNHRVIAYRSTPVRDSFGGTVDVWAETAGTPAGNNAHPDQGWSGAQQDHGPGEQQGAKRRWFLHADFDVSERDILVVVSGAESPKQVRVESVMVGTSTRRAHAVDHYEVNVEVWEGEDVTA